MEVEQRSYATADSPEKAAREVALSAISLYAPTMPKRIRRDELMTLVLTSEERKLILEETFVEGELRARLEKGIVAGSEKVMTRLTPDDLDELLGWIAAAANHEENVRLRVRLDRMYDRIVQVEDALEGYEP